MACLSIYFYHKIGCVKKLGPKNILTQKIDLIMIIKKYRILFFILFTYLLTFIGGSVFFSQQLDNILQEGLHIILKIIFIPAVFAPFFIAMLMRYIENKWQGIKDLLRLFVNKNTKFHWYILALLIPILVHLTASLLDTLRGEPFGQPFANADQNLIFTAIQVFFLAGLAEEMGWRGYLQPVLQKKFSSAVLSLIIGIVVAFWHLPLFFRGNDIHYSHSFLQFLILMIVIAYIYTWLMDNTQSILILALFHTSHDISSTGFSQADYLSATVLYGIVAITIISICGLDKFIIKKPEKTIREISKD